MVRITNDAEGKVIIGLLEIDKGKQADNEDGKPMVEGYHISITHTIGYVAVILSRNYEVGIDIEYFSNRVNRIASRFLRCDEIFTNTLDTLTAWCAKETIYKLFSSEHLALQEIKVNPQLRTVTNFRQNLTFEFKCECTPKYILTYTWY